MLQRFSTGLISGEFGGQHVFSVKFGRFFCTMPGWPWLHVLAAHLGRTSCGDWNWTIFACLLLHSHFYGEGQASLLSLICCWCSNCQSKSVLEVKNVSQWDRGLSFRPIWSILNFFKPDMLEELGSPENPKQYHFLDWAAETNIWDIRPKKENHPILPQWGFCTA